MALIRYRSGLSRLTFQPLVGVAHLRQSVEDILTTQKGERWRLLDYGADLVKRIGQSMYSQSVLELYMDAITAIHANEPELRVAMVQLVEIDRTGVLGLGIDGTYFPHGRFRDFSVQQPVAFTAARSLT